VVKATGEQAELNRPFDQVKGQIANKLFREKKTKEFDEWLKKLREEAKVTVDEKALEAIDVAAGAPAGGAPGMMGEAGHGMPARPGMTPPRADPSGAPRRTSRPRRVAARRLRRSRCALTGSAPSWPLSLATGQPSLMLSV
jgi:peptidyl-prolyl cis-trans isomerase C